MKILDLDLLKAALNNYLDLSGPGSQTRLSNRSGVSAMVISRVARGIAATTQHSWRKLHEAEPELIPPPAWKEIDAVGEHGASYVTEYDRLKKYAEMLRLAKESDDPDIADYITNKMRQLLDDLAKEDADDGKKQKRKG